MTIIPIEKYSLIKELASNEDISESLNLLYEYGEYLGSGDNRDAFKVCLEKCDPIVFKIDFSNNAPDQTIREIEIYCKYKHKFIPKIYDWDCKKFRWLEMEYLSSIEDKEKPLIKDIEKFAKVIKSNKWNEFYRTEHWGKNTKGEIKVRDFGL